MSTISSSAPARRSLRHRSAATLPVPALRYCGVDISAKPGNQQLVTLHERRGADGRELVATFYEPGTVADVAQTILAFGGEAVVAIDAPSAPRLDLLAKGQPLREHLQLPDGRYETMRVCDTVLFRRRLPLYPVPASGAALTQAQGWMQQGFDLFAALEPLQRFTPDAATAKAGTRARSTTARCGSAASPRPTRTPSSARCSATARRPSARLMAYNNGS